MAETEKSDKQAPILLVVPTEKKQQRHQPAAVELVSISWALFNAMVAVASFAVAYTLCKTTGAAAEKDVNALVVVHVCCSVLEAAVVVLAMLVAGHRRALAYVALALGFASHCFLASFVADAPGPLYLMVSGTVAALTFEAGDLLCVLALLRGGED